MDLETCWDRTVAERQALGRILLTLTAAQWEHPSMCQGWRVRDVAAHVISAPQFTWGETMKLLPQMWRGMAEVTRRDGVRRGSVPTGEILAQFTQWAGVRKGPAAVGHLEPLIDALVHTQDIVRPLGIEHHMPADAAATAADQCRKRSRDLNSTAAIGAVRMVASDIEWERGEGPEIRGPMEELLMLCAGRPARWEGLTGPGVEVLRNAEP